MQTKDKNGKYPSSELTHSMVHYLMTIHNLKENRGYARVTDIATELSFTKGSVSTAISGLKKRGLVVEDNESKFIDLSEEGHQKVHLLLSSRTLLFHFLKDILGVSEKAASEDSCLMEHLMSDETRKKFFQFMKEMVCDCENEDSSQKAVQKKFKTDLELCHFKTPEEFILNQKANHHF